MGKVPGYVAADNPRDNPVPGIVGRWAVAGGLRGWPCGEQFRAYLLISAVALFKIVLKYNKRRPPAEHLNALGIMHAFRPAADP